MQTLRSKTKLVLTSILVMAMALNALTVMPANAQFTNMQEGGSMALPPGVTPDLSLNTLPYLSFRPNPVGLGQTVMVNLWIQPPLHVSRYFKDFTVTITTPDGTKIVRKVDSYRADSTAWFEFVPDKVGTWKLKFDFIGAYFPPGNYTVTPGAWIGGQVVNFPQSVYYKPSSTEEYPLIVQQDPVLFWPSSPLPTDYWTRPVSPEHREWWSILGSFPSTGVVGKGSDWPAKTNQYMSNYGFIPYVQAPNSAHIVWKRQDNIGGLIGGLMGPLSWTAGGVNPTIVYAGRAYDTITKPITTWVNGSVRTVPTSVWRSYDLRTGRVYWEITDVPAPTMVGYEFGFSEVPGADPQFGRNVYLIAISGGRLIKYAPMTGAVAQNVSISPFTAGTFYANFDLPYFLTVQDLGAALPAAERYRLINWTVTGDVGSMLSLVNIGLRVKNNITWPFSSLPTTVDYQAGVAVSTYAISHPASGSGVAIEQGLQAADIYTGRLLWNKTSGTGFGTFPASVADQGKFAARFNDGHWHCWDLRTGEKLWKSEMTSFPWGTFGCYGVQSYGGMIISNQYDGVAAFNWTNGKQVWFYEYTAQYPYETPYQDSYPFFTGVGRVVDGKLYTHNTEHTASQPITRGWRLHCINITTGKGIWNITGSMTAGAVADGYLTASNAYDGYLYVFGKGTSATTVTAPKTAVTLGKSVVIEGTVLDMSPAQEGTACVSEASMSQWMEYLHMQKPFPSNFKGVEVALDVFDANGNYRNIGKATTDARGVFSFVWEPDIPGEYKIIATFAGSDSYGSSYASTGMYVEEAPPAPAEPEPTPLSVADAYFVPAVVGIVAVLVVIVILLVLLLFKKRS